MGCGERERFIAIERVEFAQSARARTLWVNVVLNRADLKRLDCSQQACLSQSGLAPHWRSVRVAQGFSLDDAVLIEQVAETGYGQHPSQNGVGVCEAGSYSASARVIAFRQG